MEPASKIIKYSHSRWATEQQVRDLFACVVTISGDNDKIHRATQWCKQYLKSGDAIIDVDFLRRSSDFSDGSWFYLIFEENPAWAMIRMEEEECLFFFQDEIVAVEFKLAYG